MTESAIKTQLSWDEHNMDDDDDEFSHYKDHHHDGMERPDSRGLGIGDDRQTKVCRVCGDRALSVNFNVVTCESCKAFFRRNALKPKAFRCPFSGVCEINVVSRKFCKKCRLRKCFEVGMMKEWIMSDEARLKKRELINKNREKRRTVIMATAAMHGLEASEVSKIDSSDDVSCLDAPKNHAFADDGYFTSERSNDETVSDNVPSDQHITVPKSALIEFAVQCRCPYKDLSTIIDDFVDRHTTGGKHTKSSFTRETVLQHSKSTMCDCGPCTDYRLKIPSLSGITKAAAQVRLPTLNAEMTKLDEAAGPNMLSFLAPSFGKYYHAVEYPLSVGAQNVVPPPQPPPINNVRPTPWTDSVTSMPTVPLDFPSHIYDMVNLSIQRPPTLSCPLPVKLVTQHDDMMPPLVHDDISKHSPPGLMADSNPFSGGPGSGAASIVGYAMAGKLSKLPYSMLPRLQELLDAKKFLLIDSCGDAKSEIKMIDGGTAEFFKHIAAFSRLPESDQFVLLKANRSEITILRNLILYDVLQAGLLEASSAAQFEICKKYVKIFPKLWRHDDCIMLTLMAIAVFNTAGCELPRKNAVQDHHEFYMGLLRKYLECIYKPGEVQAAQTALMDIIADMRYENTGRISVPDPRPERST